MLHPQKEGESLADWTMRLTQILTANDPPEVFLDAARQLVEAYGVEMIAERMRAVGDDHFAAGSFIAACGAYSAGIEKHDPEVGDSAQLMHCPGRSEPYLSFSSVPPQAVHLEILSLLYEYMYMYGSLEDCAYSECVNEQHFPPRHACSP